MKSKKGIFAGALLGGLGLIATMAAAHARHYSNYIVYVRSGAELAAAIEKANANSEVRYIKCIAYRGCSVKGSLPDYTGRQRLKIDGYGSTIDASGSTDRDAFAAVGGGSLRLIRLKFVGGMSGIYVEVPADRQGTQQLELWRVSVEGAALHGVFLNDANKAPAGVRLAVYASRFLENGFKDDSQNGIHVIETGDGRVAARALYSSFERNGADGLGIHESGDGGVALMVAKSRFEGNGENPVNPKDRDDGLDIDENGNGDVWLMVYRSRFNENFDDGVDIDERDEGSIFSLLNHIEANDNGDQGLTYDEQDGGNHIVRVKDSQVENNDVGSQEIDIIAAQDGGGTGTLTLENVAVGNIASAGVEVIVLP